VKIKKGIENLLLLGNVDSALGRSNETKHEVLGAEEGAVGRVREGLGNLLGSLDAAQLDETGVVLDGLTDELGRLGLTLSADNNGALVLEGLVDKEASALSLLLGNLLALDGTRVLATELELGDGHILKENVEMLGTNHKVSSDELGNLLTLGDKLGGVELGDNLLTDLVHNGGKNTLVVVSSELAVDGWQVAAVRAVEHTDGNVDHLQIAGASEGGDVAGAGTHIVDGGVLKPGHAGVDTFTVCLLTETSHPVEHDSLVTRGHIEAV